MDKNAEIKKREREPQRTRCDSPHEKTKAQAFDLTIRIESHSLILGLSLSDFVAGVLRQVSFSVRGAAHQSFESSPLDLRRGEGLIQALDLGDALGKRLGQQGVGRVLHELCERVDEPPLVWLGLV